MRSGTGPFPGGRAHPDDRPRNNTFRIGRPAGRPIRFRQRESAVRGPSQRGADHDHRDGTRRRESGDRGGRGAHPRRPAWTCTCRAVSSARSSARSATSACSRRTRSSRCPASSARCASSSRTGSCRANGMPAGSDGGHRRCRDRRPRRAGHRGSLLGRDRRADGARGRRGRARRRAADARRRVQAAHQPVRVPGTRRRGARDAQARGDRGTGCRSSPS